VQRVQPHYVVACISAIKITHKSTKRNKNIVTRIEEREGLCYVM
jgi:hypothetical protein